VNNKDFNLILFLTSGFIVLLFVVSFWECYLHYLTRKQIIESLKFNDSKFSAEQIQGLVNSTRK